MMPAWLWRMVSRTPTTPDETPAPAARPHPRRKAGAYHALYEYLENRYADTVVLTLEQIEALLGFALPAPARSDQGWWTDAGVDASDSRSSDAWTLAHRTARPNLTAQTVAFERVG